MAHKLGSKVAVFLIILAIFHPEISNADVVDMVSGAWNTLWSVSCEYSSRTVTRSKRSLEFPNPDNAEDLFQYLYPLLNLKAEDVLAEGARSLSLNSWMEDLVEYWKIECSKAKAKHKTATMNTTKDTKKSTNSTEGTLGSAKNLTMANNTNLLANKLGGYENNTLSTNKTTRQANQVLGVGLPGPAIISPALDYLGISTIATPTVSPLALHRDNKWFNSYGGDIEYFFPLIGFGIPFDGEITLLGFHGFKGLFPYKR